MADDRVWRLIVVSPEGMAWEGDATYRDVSIAQEVALVPQDLAHVLNGALHNIGMASRVDDAEFRRRAADSLRKARLMLKAREGEVRRGYGDDSGLGRGKRAGQ